MFRPCFGTSSEHMGQAGCFRLPVKACRPQPPLRVPESSNLRSEFSGRWPRTGQGKLKSEPGKERDGLLQHPCQHGNQVEESWKRFAESLRGREVSSREAPASFSRTDIHSERGGRRNCRAEEQRAASLFSFRTFSRRELTDSCRWWRRPHPI